MISLGLFSVWFFNNHEVWILKYMEIYQAPWLQTLLALWEMEFNPYKEKSGYLSPKAASFTRNNVTLIDCGQFSLDLLSTKNSSWKLWSVDLQSNWEATLLMNFHPFQRCGSRDVNVVLLVGWSITLVQTEMLQQLLPCHAQAFMVSRKGINMLTLVISRLFLEPHH